MSGQPGVISLVLERDGHDQPWGFRLQGGSDVAMPLSVQRVLVGSPADGTLLKGDIITKISCTDTKGITHQQAADLFNNAGNQIAINIKRPGVAGVPAGAQAATTPLVNGTPGQAASSVPVTRPSSANSSSENPAVRSLPKTPYAHKSSLLPPQKKSVVNMETLSIQSQPYRTLPLVQPTAKVYSGELGAGSIVHLRMQEEHITGVREPKASPESQALAAKAKHDELVMKNKVAGSLQQIQQNQSLNSARQPSPNLQYNSPLPLYSPENVAEAMKVQVSPTHTPTINPTPIQPNKPMQVILTPSKEFNPQSSATWRALQETDAPSVDLEKVANYSALKEHDPIYSEIYEAPVAPKPGQRPPPRTNASPGPRSPVSELLPSSFKAATNNVETDSHGLLSPPKTTTSAVRDATLAESKPVNHQMTRDPVKIPLYETNSIGGRKRIAQTATFNKIMMDVLGE